MLLCCGGCSPEDTVLLVLARPYATSQDASTRGGEAEAVRGGGGAAEAVRGGGGEAEVVRRRLCEADARACRS